MADSKDAAAPVPPAQPAIEDALSAAEGTRKTAMWIASALGAVPSATIVASIISGPGEGGFDSCDLALGIALAALGVALGISVFARVITPLAFEDFNFAGFPMARIPGAAARFKSFKDLEEVIESYQSTLGTSRTELANAKAVAARATAEAVVAEGSLTISLARVENASTAEKAALETQAGEARAHAQEKRNAAEGAEGRAKSLAESYAHSREQLAAAEQIRQSAYRLKTADEVRARFDKARYWLWPVVALAAAGIYFVGIAPKPKPAEPKPPVLVALTLSEAGEEKICPVKTLQALQVGGDEKAPQVITLPTPECPSKTLTFKKEDSPALGSVAVVEPIKAK